MRARLPFDDPQLEAEALHLDAQYAESRRAYPGTRRGYQAHRRGIQDLHRRAALVSSTLADPSPIVRSKSPPRLSNDNAPSSYTPQSTGSPPSSLSIVKTSPPNSDLRPTLPKKALLDLPSPSGKVELEGSFSPDPSLPKKPSTLFSQLTDELPLAGLTLDSAPSPSSSHRSSLSFTPILTATTPDRPDLPPPLRPSGPAVAFASEPDLPRSTSPSSPSHLPPVPPPDIVQAVSAITQLWCTCNATQAHIVNGQTSRFGLAEAVRHLTSTDPVSPASPTNPTDPLAFFHANPTATGLPRAASPPPSYATLLSAQYASEHQLKLHIRDTADHLDPHTEIVTVFDVDSVWYPLTLADITVPVQIAYTAHRQHTITQNPQVTFHGVATHTVVNAAIGQVTVDSAVLRLYLFFPHLPGSDTNHITDEQQQVWTDHYLLPAIHRTYPSYYHQDHPKSWQDAHHRSRARTEFQQQDHAPLANFSYALHPRFLGALQDDLASHLPSRTCPRTHPHFAYRDSFFMLIGHNFKLQFRDPCHRTALAEYHTWTARFLRPEYRTSATYRQQAFADFGVEHAPTTTADAAVTLLHRRSCLEQKLQALHGPRALHTRDTLFPWAQTHDAATALQVISPPNQYHHAAGLVYVKHYNIDKHRFGTPFHAQVPFAAEFLELVILTPAQLLAAQKATRANNYAHEVPKARRTLTTIYARLYTAMHASRTSSYAIRTEMRIHHAGLEQLASAALPSLARAPSSEAHPCCFLLRSTDVAQFWLAQIRRYALALESQSHLAQDQPTLLWNDPYVGLHLATATTIRRLMTTLFTGALWSNQLTRAGYFDRRKRWPSSTVRDEVQERQRRIIASGLFDRCDRIGLNMSAIIRDRGMYWLWDYVFTFEHGVSLRLPLVPQLTFSRFRAWPIPRHQSWFWTAGRSQVSFLQPALRQFVREVVEDCRSFTERYGSSHDGTLPFRLIVVHLLEPIAARIAIDYFEFLESVTGGRHDPQPVLQAYRAPHDDPLTAPVPFSRRGEPLTYHHMCRLLGHAAHLKPTRALTRQVGLPHQGRTWDDRLRLVFDPTFRHRKPQQWDDALFRTRTRQYLTWMTECGLAARERDLFLLFLPRLLAAYIWIMPMFDERTLMLRDRHGVNTHQPSFMVQLADLRHPSLTAVRPIGTTVHRDSGYLIVPPRFAPGEREHLINMTVMLRSIHFIVGYLRDSSPAARPTTRRAKMMRYWWRAFFPVYSHSPSELENLPGFLFAWNETTVPTPSLLCQSLRYVNGRIATLEAGFRQELHGGAPAASPAAPPSAHHDDQSDADTTSSASSSYQESDPSSSDHEQPVDDDAHTEFDWTPRRMLPSWSPAQMEDFHHPDFNPK